MAFSIFFLIKPAFSKVLMFGQTYSEIFSHENRNEESEPLLRDLRVGSGEESRKI